MASLISTYKKNTKKIWEIVRGAIGKVKNWSSKFPEYFWKDDENKKSQTSRPQKLKPGNESFMKITDKKLSAEEFNKFYREIGPKLASKITALEQDSPELGAFHLKKIHSHLGKN